MPRIAEPFGSLPLAFFSGGPWEYIIIGLVVLLLFGKRLPQMARSMGSSVIEFKKGLRNESADEQSREQLDAAAQGTRGEAGQGASATPAPTGDSSAR